VNPVCPVQKYCIFGFKGRILLKIKNSGDRVMVETQNLKKGVLKMEIKLIGVVGAGQMGSGIAEAALNSGSTF
jgi:hypothetical protein